MRRLLVLLALAGCTLPVADAQESPWRLGAAIGYGERSNPLVFSDDVPLVVDLDIGWFGERFFFDNGDLGFMFADNERFTANFVARVRSDRVFFGLTNTRFVRVGLTGAALDDAVRVKVPDRDYAIEAGVELLTDGSFGFLQVGAFHDVSGTHDGFDIDVMVGTGIARGRWYFEPAVGLNYKSRRQNDYYWGIRPSESNEATPVYAAGDGVNVRARLSASYYFTRAWSGTLSAEYERINDAAADSPIVSDDAVIGWFAGVHWRFR